MSNGAARFSPIVPFVVGTASILSVACLGHVYLDGFMLRLGSLTIPEATHMYFIVFWVLFGLAAASAFALGFSRLRNADNKLDQLRDELSGISDRKWIIGVAVLALLSAAYMRYSVLKGMPITDDEPCYRFMAQLLASGRLVAESPSLKLFFDHAFMINDGKMYSQYFIGWPLLMVPGEWLRIPGYVNAFYFMLTVPALFLVVRRICGSNWAKLASLLFISSPMLLIGASTGLSHTSCFMLLMWMCWFTARSRDVNSPLWSHFGTAFFFAVAFLVRPTTAIGAGLPFLLLWIAGVFKNDHRSILGPLISFAIPVVALGAVFLVANSVQTGSMLLPPYQRYLQYMDENLYRFALLKEAYHWRIVNYCFSDPLRAVAYTAAAIIRLNVAVFGWPVSLIFIPLAMGREVRVYWYSLLCFFAVHFFLTDSGIDSFGPVHFFEAIIPIIVLTVYGARKACGWTAWLADQEKAISTPRPGRWLPLLFLLCCVAMNAAIYLPVKIGALFDIASQVKTPHEALKSSGLKNAVVFVQKPFVPRGILVTRHFVSWYPVNDPDLQNDILLVNHISLEHNRQLMKYFPRRQGYFMKWDKDMKPVFVPLDTPGLQLPFADIEILPGDGFDSAGTPGEQPSTQGP